MYYNVKKLGQIIQIGIYSSKMSKYINIEGTSKITKVAPFICTMKFSWWLQLFKQHEI